MLIICLNYVPVENLSLREHRHNHILAGERKFLYEMFRYVRENKLKFKPRLYNWFYVYLRIKEKIRGEMVQSNKWVGFEKFFNLSESFRIFFKGCIFGTDQSTYGSCFVF